MSLQQIVLPTPSGPLVLRPRQVVKCEGAYFMIESVNQVRNGNQIRMYHMHESEALKYYIPTRPAPVAAPTVAVAQPVIKPAPAAAPGLVPGGQVSASPVVQDGSVPAAVAESMLGSDVERKPLTGLTNEEIQEGLAMGKFTQDDDGNVFPVPGFKDPSDPMSGAAPNHTINIKTE